MSNSAKRKQQHCIEHTPYYLSGLSPAYFSDNLSRNNCIIAYFREQSLDAL